MGVGDEFTLIEPLDADVLKWPKRLLASLYVGLALWSCYQTFSFEMDQEKFVIRLILIAFLFPLSGFVLVGYKWAMSSAYTVLLCYFGAFYLLLELRLSLGLVALIFFLGILTLRAMTATDQARALKQSSEGQIFE